MLKAAHRVLIVLIAFAIIGGTSQQLARSAQYAQQQTAAEMPCDMAMSAPHARHAAPELPCKGMTIDCIKQMGCVTVTALPAQTLKPEVAVRFSPVDYWTAGSALAGLIHEPEPLPPRTT